MIQTTFNSVAVLLVKYRPDWVRPVVSDFDKATSMDVGLSMRENRVELAAELITRLQYSTLLNPTEAALVRAGMAAWTNQPILCPFWPAETLAANYANSAVQGQVRVWYEPDWSAWSINTGTAPGTFTPSQYCLTAPVIYGRFQEMPLQAPLSGNDDELAGFNIVEEGPAAYALKPKAVTLVTGATINGGNPPVMNVPFSWGDNEMQTEVRIKRGQVGFGRKSADTFYAQAPRTKSTLHFLALNGDELAYMLKLFYDRGGSVKPFWCSTPFSLAQADRVYGRFYGDKLTITWRRPCLGDAEVGEMDVEFLSLPTESTVPGGEVFAGSIGPVVGPWYGYKITCGSETWYVSSYESAVTGPAGQTYQPAMIEHGVIDEEINLAINDCTLKIHTQDWPSCPFAVLVQQLSADPMMVTIYEGTIANPAAAVAIYTGQAMAPKTKGPGMTVKLRGPGAILTVKGPRLVMQETCAAVLGDSRCTKDLAALTITQTLLSITNGVGDVNVAGAGFTAGYFKGGFAERTITGPSGSPHVQRVPISDSYTNGASRLAVLFGAQVMPAPVGAETGWKFVPGCDGFFKTCHTVFGNKLNFRAAPYLPKTNPSILPIQSSTTGAGKKG